MVNDIANLLSRLFLEENVETDRVHFQRKTCLQWCSFKNGGGEGGIAWKMVNNVA